MASFEAVRDLTLRVDGFAFHRLSQVVATRRFERATTVVTIGGDGAAGHGEDVALDRAVHDRPPARKALAPLTGEHRLGAWCDAVGELAAGLFSGRDDAGARAGRWALESAGLDLALRQAGLALGEALGRAARPVRFVASFRLGEPPSLDPVRVRLSRYPDLRLKVDPTTAWPQEAFDGLAATGAVDVADLKGAYAGTMVDQAPDAELYERVARAFPDALIEDPACVPETQGFVARERERLAWDAPVRAADDLAALPPAVAVNVKPSRVGSLRALLDLYDRCEADGWRLYGGGLFELGPGRVQIQELASLFHPDGPNDVAPAGYNAPEPPHGLPVSPLPAAARTPGFGAGWVSPVASPPAPTPR